MKCGAVAVVGKPNVGKTTLMNQIVGEKVGIVSPKPQTTRTAIVGIANRPGAQIIFHDTPGIHKPKTKLGDVMVERAVATLHGADIVLFVVDVSRMPNDEDERIAQLISLNASAHRVVALNKMDRLRPEHVREHYAACEALSAPSELIYTNALSGENIDKLVDLLVARLPEGAALYDDPDLYTTQTQREMAAELIREQVLIATREEVPHGCGPSRREASDAHLRGYHCGAQVPKAHSHRPRWKHAQAHRFRGAEGDRANHREPGVPRAVRQGSKELA